MTDPTDQPDNRLTEALELLNEFRWCFELGGWAETTEDFELLSRASALIDGPDATFKVPPVSVAEGSEFSTDDPRLDLLDEGSVVLVLNTLQDLSTHPRRNYSFQKIDGVWAQAGIDIGAYPPHESRPFRDWDGYIVRIVYIAPDPDITPEGWSVQSERGTWLFDDPADWKYPFMWEKDEEADPPAKAKVFSTPAEAVSFLYLYGVTASCKAVDRSNPKNRRDITR